MFFPLSINLSNQGEGLLINTADLQMVSRVMKDNYFFPNTLLTRKTTRLSNIELHQKRAYIRFLKL